jgi:DNA repair protein RadA
MNDNEEDLDIKEIEDIPNLGPKTAENLKDKLGIKTLRALAIADAEVIAKKINGISEDMANKFIDYANRALGIRTEVDGFSMLEEKLNLIGQFTITTGSEKFDEMLGGGVKGGESYEFYGEYRTGKTETALQVCTNAMLPKEQGGLGEDIQIIWIATESFPVQRALDLIQSKEEFQGDEDTQVGIGKQTRKISEKQRKLLSNYTIIECRNDPKVQTNAPIRIANRIDDFPNLKIIVVDSLIAIYRATYIGLDQLSVRQKVVNKFIKDIKDIGRGCALIFTNQVVQNITTYGSGGTKATGGNIVAHNLENIVEFKKGKGKERIVRLRDSQDLPPGEAKFQITENGIAD